MGNGSAIDPNSPQGIFDLLSGGSVMTIQGLRTSENFATNERPENWRKGLLMLDPNGSALSLLLLLR